MSKRILVIDDEEAIRKSFTLALEDTGYQVETAVSGEQGINKAQGTKYDLIFLDLKMPGLDGAQTLWELRNMDKDTPIYIITAFYDEFFDQLSNAAKAGIEFEVLRKPIGSAQIVLITKSVLEGATEVK